MKSVALVYRHFHSRDSISPMQIKCPRNRINFLNGLEYNTIIN